MSEHRTVIFNDPPADPRVVQALLSGTLPRWQDVLIPAISLDNPGDFRSAQRMIKLVQRGRCFVNGEEVFHLSKTKARKLAYRWRGNRRGRRIIAWLERSKLPAGMTLETPVVYNFKKK